MSSTTSQKFRDFTGEPLKDKQISDVPGLGPKLASNLEESTKITKVCFIHLNKYRSSYLDKRHHSYQITIFKK
jgi:hypothetical protein